MATNSAKAPPTPAQLRFVDLKERNDVERERMKRRIRELEQAGVKVPSGKQPKTADSEQLDYLKKHVGDPVVDPIFLAVADDVAPGQNVSHKDGLPPSQVQKPPVPLTAAEKAVIAIYGIVVRDNSVAPLRLELGEEIDRRSGKGISNARSEYLHDEALYAEILTGVMVEVGDRPGGKEDHVRATDWSAVTKRVSERGGKAGDLYTRFQAETALEGLRGGDEDQAPSAIEIDLPDLDEEVDVEIVVDNLQAMQAIYFSSMLEEIKLYQVADKLIELFNMGLLPLGKGRAGDLLFEYWRKSNERFTEIERLNLYARAFGFPVGEPMPSGAPNREFEGAWIRFVSAVSSLLRQSTLNSLLTSSLPGAVSQEQVRKAGRDLAANLSLYGYGVAYFAATDLQGQIRDVIELLSSDEIKSAYGARDMWQVIDQVVALENLGKGGSTVKGRTMATAGSVIIRWLSQHPAELASVGKPVVDQAAVSLGHKSPKPMSNPTDRDLVDACEQWLAVTGTPDAQVEVYAQPIETPNSTSRPIQIPAVARDALAGIGLNGA